MKTILIYSYFIISIFTFLWLEIYFIENVVKITKDYFKIDKLYRNKKYDRGLFWLIFKQFFLLSPFLFLMSITPIYNIFIFYFILFRKEYFDKYLNNN